MPSMPMTIPRCATLYLVYNGTDKRSDIVQKYAIRKETIYWLLDKQLLTAERKGKYVILSLTPLGKALVEHNLDTCKKSLDVLKKCREEKDPNACYEVQFLRFDVPVP